MVDLEMGVRFIKGVGPSRVEILKKLNALDDTARTVALLKITDDNIKSIIRAL